MTSTNGYQPRAEDKFSFGLWTVSNPGRDAFGDAARPKISPIENLVSACLISRKSGKLEDITTPGLR